MLSLVWRDLPSNKKKKTKPNFCLFTLHKEMKAHSLRKKIAAED